MGESGCGGVEQAESPLARLRYRRLCVQWRKGDGRPADTEKCETRVQSIWRRAQLAELADLSFEVRTDVVPRLIFHRKDDSQPRVRRRAPFDGAAGSRSLNRESWSKARVPADRTSRAGYARRIAAPRRYSYIERMTERLKTTVALLFFALRRWSRQPLTSSEVIPAGWRSLKCRKSSITTRR